MTRRSSRRRRWWLVIPLVAALGYAAAFAVLTAVLLFGAFRIFKKKDLKPA